MKAITGKKGMIPRIRELLGAGKSDAQIMALVKPTWPICTPYEIGYARRTQKKTGKKGKKA